MISRDTLGFHSHFAEFSATTHPNPHAKRVFTFARVRVRETIHDSNHCILSEVTRHANVPERKRLMALDEPTAAALMSITRTRRPINNAVQTGLMANPANVSYFALPHHSFDFALLSPWFALRVCISVASSRQRLGTSEVRNEEAAARPLATLKHIFTKELQRHETLFDRRIFNVSSKFVLRPSQWR